MLIVTKNNKTTPPTFVLSGVVDETTNFSEQLDAAETSMNVNCKDVSRINSVGIKLWREYFDKCRSGGCKLKFSELSPSLVATVNYISDFVAKAEIESFCAPYLCMSCNKVTLLTLMPSQISEIDKAIPKVNCAACGLETELDEIPDEYFAFLR